MTATYREILQQLRLSFPQPVSHPIHDACFVFSILRSLDQIDAMKSDIPLLGKAKPLDYTAALRERIPTDPSWVEDVAAELVRQFEGLPIWGHPHTQMNVVTCPSIAALKAYVLSPFIDEAHVELLVHKVLEARQRVGWKG